MDSRADWSPLDRFSSPCKTQSFLLGLYCLPTGSPFSLRASGNNTRCQQGLQKVVDDTIRM
jgi:hypothetical protein